ncbi:hypothetical protein Q8A67_018713 [Cirrhinus molitorella]|uniref:Uncharacterized protein n=1 Tax=Cirrhinus molitorella TaxID=172907 RepID=A0AA88TR07_9TELE|nr:hypothetical protein Q8A67_018713 [Cirrhinus molitorella]
MDTDCPGPRRGRHQSHAHLTPGGDRHVSRPEVGKTGTLNDPQEHHWARLLQTMNSTKQLFSVTQTDQAHTPPVTALMSDMRREVSSSVDSLTIDWIPPYLVPLSVVMRCVSISERKTQK